jgi:type I restriction enzyme M protein
MKQRLQILGFKPKENTSNLWIKTYGSYSITIDFDKQQINYGSKIRSES